MNQIIVMVGLLLCGGGLASDNRLILISIDGFRWDYLDKFAVPNLKNIALSGVRVQRLQPVFPTLTFPNHYSIATGLYPENHGVIANQFWDPTLQQKFKIDDRKIVGQSQWWGGEPIWVTAEKQKLVSASMFWVGTEAEISGIRPTYWLPYDREFLAGERVKKVLSWLDLPEGKRPRLVTLYFDSVDTAGHAYGPNSPEVARAADEVDKHLGELFQGIKSRGMWSTTTLIIVSDHGMAEVGGDRIVSLSEGAGAVETLGSGPFVQLWPKAGTEKAIINKMKKINHVTVYEKDKIPDRWRYKKNPRIAPLIAVADGGWYIRTGIMPLGKAIGAHGYDNELDSMQGLFLATGAMIKSGVVLQSMAIVDIYNGLCRILGIRPAPNDGNEKSVGRIFKD